MSLTFVALLPPHDCWLHWSMRAEGAEVRNRVRTTVGTMETSLWETDISESAQFYYRV